MTESITHQRTKWLARLAPWLLIGAIVLFYAVTNWQWLTENVTSTGWDKPRHLARSLYYNQLLSQPSIQSLFTVVVGDPVRTPLFPASATIMYQLFGRDPDVAAMVNILYLAVALAATYGIGRRWQSAGASPVRGPLLGLIAVALLAVFPCTTPCPATFTRVRPGHGHPDRLPRWRPAASSGGRVILFGLSLGPPFTKRTSAVFLIGRSGRYPHLCLLPPVETTAAHLELRHTWRLLRNVALPVIGLVPAAILPAQPPGGPRPVPGDALFAWWSWPRRPPTFPLPSGPVVERPGGSSWRPAWPPPGTWPASPSSCSGSACTAMASMTPRRTPTWATSALPLLPAQAGQRAPLAIAIFFLVILVIAVVAYVRRQGSVRNALRRVKPEAWVVLAWLASGYLFLTLSIYQETRAFTPALPAVALLFGAALLALPWRKVALALLAVVLLFGLLQFFVVSWEPAYNLMTPKTVHLPAWGRTSFFAQGVYIQLPDEGKTDRGYAIYPDVLKRMEARRQVLGQDTLSLGLLSNTSQINAGPFNLLILTGYQTYGLTA